MTMLVVLLFVLQTQHCVIALTTGFFVIFGVAASPMQDLQMKPLSFLFRLANLVIRLAAARTSNGNNVTSGCLNALSAQWLWDIL